VDLQDRDNSKQTQMLRQRLKEGGEESQSRSHSAENNKDGGETSILFSLCDTAIAAARYCSKSSFNQVGSLD